MQYLHTMGNRGWGRIGHGYIESDFNIMLHLLHPYNFTSYRDSYLLLILA